MRKKLHSKKILFALFILLTGFVACKKDALKVDTEKNYTEEKTTPVTDLAGGAMHLSLKPNGVADINPGGDIMWRGTYTISGKKIMVTIPDLDKKFKFTILSEQELESETGVRLKRQQP